MKKANCVSCGDNTFRVFDVDSDILICEQCIRSSRAAKQLALYERALALLRILRAEVPGNMFVTYEAGTGRNYRDLCDELLAEIDKVTK